MVSWLPPFLFFFINEANFQVRLVQGRPDIAFVEYDSLANAAEARTALQSFKVTPVNILKISYAKQ